MRFFTLPFKMKIYCCVSVNKYHNETEGLSNFFLLVCTKFHKEKLCLSSLL